MSNILDSVGRSPKTPKRNESVDKAKCVTPLRIELQSFNSQTCKSGDKTEFLTPLSVKLESLDLKTPKSENKTKCLTPLSVKLEYLDINSIKSGNDKKLKVEVDNYIPTHINPVHKGTIAVTKNLTPFSGKLDQLDVCPLTNLEYKQIRCTSLRNTPKRNRPATKTANSTQFSINQLDSVGSNKRFFEMNTTQKPILNVTLKDLQYNGVDPSTPQAHVQFSQELKKVLNERNILTCKTRKHVFDALDELKKTDEDESRRNKREKSLLEIVNSKSRRPVKRRDLHEYHEIGLSPGIPLKKKKTEADNISGTRNIFQISGRKPITRTPMNLEENPSVSSNASTCHSSISNTTEDSERNENVPKMSKEVFVFGKPHPNDAGFKVGSIFGRLGSSVKKFFGFKH